MRAVVHDAYGPPEVLRLADVERPVPAEDEVLVRVRATTVTRSDCGWRSGKPFVSRFFTGVRAPSKRILGTEFSGEVAAVGTAVQTLAVGDRVFGTSLFGANAEYVCMRAGGPIARMPAGLSFEEAAAVCDGFVLAVGCLRRAGAREGQRLLVYGASGAIGTAAVQLGAHHFGVRVTGVCNTKNVELVRSLGAEEVIDYAREDFTRNGLTYDVVFDAVGKHSFARSRGSLARGGVFVTTDGFENLAWAAWTWRIGDRKVVMDIPPRYRRQDILLLKQLIESGRYRPVVDRVYPLDDVVEATRYVETQQKVGNVVLTVAQPA